MLIPASINMSDNENSQDLINFDSDDYWMVEIEDLVDKKTTDELVNDETTVEKKTDDSVNRYKRPGNNLLQSVSNALQPSCTVTKK